MKSGIGKIFLKFLHALTMSFVLLNFDQKYKFSNKNNMVSTWRNFKNIFPRPLFTIIFRPEMLKFHPYSIWTGDTRVEFVIYYVLMNWKIEKVKAIFIHIDFLSLFPPKMKNFKSVVILVCQTFLK